MSKLDSEVKRFLDYHGVAKSKADTFFIVVLQEGKTVMMDLTTNKPFVTGNRKLADYYAKQQNGAVITLTEGLKLLQALLFKLAASQAN